MKKKNKIKEMKVPYHPFENLRAQSPYMFISPFYVYVTYNSYMWACLVDWDSLKREKKNIFTTKEVNLGWRGTTVARKKQKIKDELLKD